MTNTNISLKRLVGFSEVVKVVFGQYTNLMQKKKFAKS